MTARQAFCDAIHTFGGQGRVVVVWIVVTAGSWHVLMLQCMHAERPAQEKGKGMRALMPRVQCVRESC
jgi:hypothetical protein